MNATYSTVAEAYMGLARYLSRCPALDTRLGAYHEAVNCNITILKPWDRLAITAEDDPSFEGYLVAQWAWYASAIQKPLLKPWYPHEWTRVALDTTDFNSNYGQYVWAEKQFNHCFKLLSKDSSSRRAVILLNRPTVAMTDTQDHICTTSLQFLVRGDYVHLITTMRSNELHFGFRTDVVFFTMLQEIMARILGKEVGSYFHNVGSMHAKLGSLVKRTPVAREWPLIDKHEVSDLLAFKSILTTGDVQDEGPYTFTNNFVQLAKKFFAIA